MKTTNLIDKKIIFYNEISFTKITSNSPYFYLIDEAFKKLITPVYGDQKKAINKIKSGRDRTCEIMFIYSFPIGIIIYKNKLQNEYDFSQGLELKTLLLFNPKKNSRKGFGSILFKRIERIGTEKGAKLIYCTASSVVNNSIQCALKNGYKIVKILEMNKFKEKYLLIKEITDNV